LGRNLLIAALTLALAVSTGAALFFHRLAALQAPPPIENARPELESLSSYAAWHRLVETLREAGAATVRDGTNGAPTEQDAIDRFQGLLAILSNTARMPFTDDPARPVITTFDLQPALTKIGGNSPDAEYHGFTVSPDYTYRLTGRRSRAPFSNVQVQSMRFNALAMRPSISLASSLRAEEIQYDEDDRFEILIARTQPADWTGAFLAMDDDSFNVTIREYHHDPEAEGDPDLAVEVVGPVPPPERLTDEVVAARLQRVAAMSRFWFSSRDWMPGLLDPDVVNGFPDTARARGDDEELGLNTDVRYRVGAWQLADDEVLIVEGRFPQETPYWIFQIDARWHETVDFRSRRVHLNDATAERNADGGFQLVIAPRPVEHANALDTGGRTEGFMSFRWVPVGETADTFDVRTRVVAHDLLETIRP
jgi:hypothetical protein